MKFTPSVPQPHFKIGLIVVKYCKITFLAIPFLAFKTSNVEKKWGKKLKQIAEFFPGKMKEVLIV